MSRRSNGTAMDVPWRWPGLLSMHLRRLCRPHLQRFVFLRAQPLNTLCQPIKIDGVPVGTRVTIGSRSIVGERMPFVSGPDQTELIVPFAINDAIVHRLAMGRSAP